AQALLKDVSSEPYDDAGGALVWLNFTEVLSEEELKEIEDLSISQSAFAGNAARAEAVQQMHAQFEKLATIYLQQAEKQATAALMPGPRWAWRCGGAALAAAAIWYFVSPTATPLCDDSQVQTTIRTELVSHSINSLLGAPQSLTTDLMRARFSDFEELGYLKDTRSRGCSVTLTVGDDKLPMAYTITPTENSGEMLVQSGKPRLLRARYRPIDESLGQPLGGDQLSAAFTKGVDDFMSRSR